MCKTWLESLLLVTAVFAASASRAGDGAFVSLFPQDGVPEGWTARYWNDLTKEVKDSPWIVKNGVAHSPRKRGTWLVSDKEYADFILDFEIKLGETGNSGVALRAPLRGDPAFDGMELQFADYRYNTKAKDSELTGGIYRAIAPTKQVYRPTEWNSCRVELAGQHLKVTLNGTVIQNVDLGKFDQAVKRHDGTDAPPIKDRPRRGHIGFQHLSRDAEPVLIRQARIKELPGGKPASTPAELWEAARKGDVKGISELLARGVDVNAKTHYGASALWFAAYKGRLEAAKLLIERKADLNARDTAWGLTALDCAAGGDFAEIVKVLLAAGAQGGDAILQNAASQGSAKVVRAVLESGKVKGESLDAALALAPAKPPEIRELLKKAGAKALSRNELYPPDMDVTPFTGAYETPGGLVLRISLKDGTLRANSGLTGLLILRGGADSFFKPIGNEAVSLRFERKDEKVAKVILKHGSIESIFERQASQKPLQLKTGTVADIAVPVTRPKNWPSFRGINACGVADGQHPPSTWDIKTGQNILWKTPIPGLAHSSPIVWNARVLLTTAVRLQGKSDLKPGLYGAGTPADDISPHRFEVLCFDTCSGKIIWQRTAHEGIPKIKRHIKATHANATPATDGEHIVVSFASEGLYCYDFAGQLLWKRDLGIQDAGAFNDPELQWGAASSPIIFKNMVIVQYDRHKDSYIAAFDVDTGSPLWKTPRDEHPSWGTPTVIAGPSHSELVTNATNFIRGYDPLSGRELWRLGGNSEITVPTPFAADGLIFVTNGYRPIQPIYAIRQGPSGDISLKKDTDASENIAWSKQRGGPYMPTPVVYGTHLYVCTNNGVVTCYEARTGKQVYRQRLGSTGGHSASVVAADGRVYFTSEEGDVYVVKAGQSFELLAVNKMGESCLATPAISDGMMFIRSQHHLFGIGYK